MRSAAGGVSAAAPRLRDMLHAGAFPFAAVAGLVLIALAPAQPARLAAAVYSVTCLALFGVSAAYHRSPLASRVRVSRGLPRHDHPGVPHPVRRGVARRLPRDLIPAPALGALTRVQSDEFAFYWEPTWTVVKADPSSGDGWENQAMFDYTDTALPVISDYAPR